MFEVIPYSPSEACLWNSFVEHSRQGTFLFNRGYMDYHSDRFSDCSLMFRRKGRICAVLPANRRGDILFSHQGLTYGGLLTDDRIKTADVKDIFQTLNEWLYSKGIRHVIYKAIPWIYHHIPAEEDLYALVHVCKARLSVREISSTIILSNRLKFEESRLSGIRKAKRMAVSCKESDDISTFWHILDKNLETKYHTPPVHSLKELELLYSRFPDKIKLFMAYKEEKPVGGTIIFDTGQVVHTQYISASPEGKSEGALDLLFDHIINDVYADRCIFDFGKSTEEAGTYLNNNLIFQKEGFGGRGVCYDTYEYDL